MPYVPRSVAHRYSYVVVKGYITDAENVFMETMEVDHTPRLTPHLTSPHLTSPNQPHLTHGGGRGQAVLQCQRKVQGLHLRRAGRVRASHCHASPSPFP